MSKRFKEYIGDTKGQTRQLWKSRIITINIELTWTILTDTRIFNMNGIIITDNYGIIPMAEIILTDNVIQ